jgi:hypothetical protein
VIEVEELDDSRYVVLVAYTTSTGLAFDVTPIGVHVFDADAAAALGHTRAFRLDLRRIARLPVTAKWFPFIVQQSHGVLGRAGKELRASLQYELSTLVRTHFELVAKLAGPSF